MKILQVLPTLSAGGAEGFIANLCVELAGKGVECRLYLLGGVRGGRGRLLHRMLTDAGVEVLGAAERPVKAAGHAFELARAVRRFRPDVVQANLRAAEVICMFARGLTPSVRARWIRRLANTQMSRLPGGNLGQRMFARTFDGVIACAEPVAEIYRGVIKTAHDHAVITIPNGCAVPRTLATAGARREARMMLGLPASGFGLVHVGRMTAGQDGRMETGQKAHDVLIRAFAHAFGNQEAEAFLVLLGDGELRPALESLAGGLGVGDKVRFLGVQDDPWDALAAGDVFFFPSRHEGIPNALLEAACAGLPVVAADIGEVRSLPMSDDWLLAPVDDVGGFAVALKVAMRQLEPLQQRAVERAPRFLERFAMPACADSYITAYAGFMNMGK